MNSLFGAKPAEQNKSGLFNPPETAKKVEALKPEEKKPENYFGLFKNQPEGDAKPSFFNMKPTEIPKEPVQMKPVEMKPVTMSLGSGQTPASL